MIMNAQCPRCGKELKVVTEMHCHHVDRCYMCDFSCGFRFPLKCGYDSEFLLAESFKKHEMEVG